ncbi:MAG: methyltransferase domain-containing protein [Planctomycetes bacterium]|nr:methyltransferase domain-containing protein [Planctomycetota bacterium]
MTNDRDPETQTGRGAPRAPTAGKTVVIYNETANAFAGDEVERRACGGSETDIINLARELAHRGLGVHVFCPCPRPGTYAGVVYHDLQTERPVLKPLAPDLLILSRSMSIPGLEDLRRDSGARQVVFWAHDIPADPAFRPFVQHHRQFDRIVALSHYHRQAILSRFGFVTPDAVVVIPNGVDMQRFAARDRIAKQPGRLLYSSTPFRGLEILARVFPRIRRRVPHAHLRVFSSMSLYGRAGDDAKYRPLYEKLRRTAGVEYIGSVKQDRLAREFMEAEVLAYPNGYPETCCVTAMEAQAGGAAIVTSALGALNEIVPDEVGIRIAGRPGWPPYNRRFVAAVVALLTDPDRREAMGAAGWRRDFGWDRRADRWIAHFLADGGGDAGAPVENINTPAYWDEVYRTEVKRRHWRKAPARSRIIKAHIAPGARVWDVGCGTGWLTRDIRRSVARCEVWGSDFSRVAIDFCRKKSRKITYVNRALLVDEVGPGYFDVIILSHVLEHLDEPSELVERARTFLKEGGRMILALPLDDEPYFEHVSRWRREDVARFLSRWDSSYEVFYCDRGLRARDGRALEEGIYVVRFAGKRAGA